ncbi:MAG: DUF2118 domain-containing protein [Erysipelotrichaceae bacterium]|nr:DUF2118 domain-containing protein [Erysipelotrichaceae bacterium]
MKVYKVKVNGKVYEVEVEAVDEVSGSIKTEAAAPVVKENKPVAEGDKIIAAPITGKVLEVKVKIGDMVKKGQTVAIIEAMKLENEIQSAYDGKVVDIRAGKGDDIKNKEALIVLE